MTSMPAAASPYSQRQEKLSTVLQKAGLYGLVLNPGASLVYLTGLHFHLSERPVVLIFVPEQIPCLVLPELEAQKALTLPFQVKAFPYKEDPGAWSLTFKQAALAAGIDDQKVGVEPRSLRLLEFRFLQIAAPEADFVPADQHVAALRMLKDAEELANMRRAAVIAQQALQNTLPAVKIGMSESELAAELTLQLLRQGSDPEIPFSPIVSSGPNSANPHATPTDRPLTGGDLLVIDWGASYHGYFSDITRTFAIGKVEAEYTRIAEIVMQANAAARSFARPGVAAQEVDQAARQVIEQAGYGAHFFHRTGHGLGMEGHEEPYIRSGNSMLLEPGMTFTIEPGIYLQGRNGVRIEDDVVITESGAESLTDLPRQLTRLG